MTLSLPPVIVQAKHNIGQEQKQNHLQILLDGFVDLSGLEKYRSAFNGLSDNSKKIHEGFLFLASAGQFVLLDDQIKKWPRHGIAYAGEAINRGAAMIVWEPTEELNEMPGSCTVKGKAEVPLIRVESLHEKIGEIASRFYQHPSHDMAVIGVTGTNGKTSIAHFIAQTMQRIRMQDKPSIKSKCAVIGTLGNGVYGELEESSHTTPDAVSLQTLMSDYREQGVDTLVMEVSSHALAQGRVNGVAFDTAIFTNLSRDHLDYHGDMESYGDEKLKLFQFPSLEHMVINLDDSFSGKICEEVQNRNKKTNAKLVTYSKKDNSADYFAFDIEMNAKGISFSFVNKADADKCYSVNSQLLGDFNIDNLLATIAVLHQYDYSLEKIVRAINKINTIAGRMEKIDYSDRSDKNNALNQALIVIDYAHTPDALEKSLQALKSHTQGELICVFGCGGDRDKGKRPLMATVAEQLADKVMVTSDNPRTEDAELIIADIMTGFSDRESVAMEIDRERAIKKVIQQAKADDVILVAGKGHENYQDIQGQKIPFSDKTCILKALKQLANNFTEQMH